MNSGNWKYYCSILPRVGGGSVVSIAHTVISPGRLEPLASQLLVSNTRGGLARIQTRRRSNFAIPPSSLCCSTIVQQLTDSSYLWNHLPRRGDEITGSVKRNRGTRHDSKALLRPERARRSAKCFESFDSAAIESSLYPLLWSPFSSFDSRMWTGSVSR